MVKSGYYAISREHRLDRIDFRSAAVQARTVLVILGQSDDLGFVHVVNHQEFRVYGLTYLNRLSSSNLNKPIVDVDPLFTVSDVDAMWLALKMMET